MDPGSSANIFSLLAVIAALIGGYFTARRGPAAPSGSPADPPVSPAPSTPALPPGVGPGQYYVSPEIWAQLNERISQLEETQRAQAQQVLRLQEKVDRGATERQTLRQLLRVAVRSLFDANQRLHVAHLDEVPVDPRLVPYSVEQ